MLNLKKSVVEEHWRKNVPRLAKVLSIMEEIEYWLVDEVPSVDEALNHLAKRMDRSSFDVLSNHAEELLFVMAYISSGRCLRMMNWFDERFPKGMGLSLVMVEKAQELQDEPDGHHARLLLERLQTVKSLSLMNKIFSPQRTRVIIELLKDTSVNHSY